MDNAKCYAKVCSKIGLALILFYSFFYLSIGAVAVLLEEFGEIGNKLAMDIIAEILSAIVYFFSS